MTSIPVTNRLRVWASAGVLALGALPVALASSASAVVSLPTASGSWGTLIMPSDFSPIFTSTLNWYGADAAGNVYYVPGGAHPTSAPQLRSNSRTSHGVVGGLGAGIERYTPSTGQSTFIDPARDFRDMGGLAVEPSGNVDIVVYDSTYSQRVVMRVSPSGTETVLNSTIPDLSSDAIAVDASGNVYVSTYDYGTGNSTVYEVPSGGGVATALGTIVADYITALAVAPDGRIYASSGFHRALLYSVPLVGASTSVAIPGVASLGIAFDGAGNLFSAQVSPDAVEEISPTGVAQYLPPSPALAIFGNTRPVMLAYGAGTIYMWDSTYAPLSGVRSNVYSPNILYTWTTSTGARPFLTSVDSVAARVVNRYTQSITATWTGGGPTYRCTLMTGFHNPTGFTVLTTAHSCTFYGLALGSSFGISVVSISGGVSSAPQVGFAPAPKVTITCKLGTRTLHRSGLSPTCPPGWRQV